MQVDRISSKRDVLSTSINVTTEPWGGTIVPLTPRSALKAQGHKRLPMPFAGSALFLPRTQEVADYLKQRKLLLVNSMHTVLALMTLEDHKQAHRGLALEDLLGEPDGTRRDDMLLSRQSRIYENPSLSVWRLSNP